MKSLAMFDMGGVTKDVGDRKERIFQRGGRKIDYQDAMGQDGLSTRPAPMGVELQH